VGPGKQSQFKLHGQLVGANSKRWARNPKQEHFTECDLKKQSQFAGCPNERKTIPNKRLWRFCRFETAEEQSQAKPIQKGAPGH
jgi:hypothetical protein